MPDDLSDDEIADRLTAALYTIGLEDGKTAKGQAALDTIRRVLGSLLASLRS